jgi:hypothetical protein
MTSFQEKTVNSKTQNIFWLLNQLPSKWAIFQQNRMSKWKVIALFPKAFSQNKQTLPVHSSGTGGPFGNPTPFLKYYIKTLLKMSNISQICDTFFQCDRLSMDLIKQFQYYGRLNKKQEKFYLEDFSS